MKRAYRYRLHPNKQQAEFFEKSFGCSRYVYNWGLSQKIEAYKTEKKTVSWVELCNTLTQMKKEPEHEWLNEVARESLNQSIRNLETAYKNFFRTKKGFPKYKSKNGSRPSFKVLSNVKIDFDLGKIMLPKVGWVKFTKNLTFEGKIGTVTITKSASGKYYASVLVEDGLAQPEKKKVEWENSVGIDVGIKDFAVMSDGTTYANPKYLENAGKKLAKLQRRLSRTQKGSKRRERARLKVAKAYERVNNCRSTFLHRITSQLTNDYDTIFAEDLNVQGMLQNHHLAKSIASASWSEFFRQLQYKCDWKGKNFVQIGRFEPSSKTCLCGYVNHDLQLKDRTWTCPECGRVNDRDLLAAINILRFGYKQATQNEKEEEAKQLAVNGQEKRNELKKTA